MATNNAINQHKPFPLFFAYLDASTGSVTGDGTAVTIPFNTTSFNDGSYNTGTYTMTAPVTGVYLLNANFLANNCNGKNGIAFSFTVPGSFHLSKCNPDIATTGTQYAMNSSLIIKLTAADTVYIELNIAGGAKNCAILSSGAVDPRTWFSATLIG